MVVGWPARGLYALGGRSRSGKAADSFRQIEDFFCYMMIGGDLLLLNWPLVGLCSPLLLLFVVIVVQANCGDVDDDDDGGGRLMIVLCCFVCCMVCCWCSSALAGDDWHWCVSVPV